MKKPMSFPRDRTLDWLRYIEAVLTIIFVAGWTYQHGGVWPYLGALAISGWLYLIVIEALAEPVIVSTDGLSLPSLWGQQFIAWEDMVVHENLPPRRILGMLVCNPSLDIKFSARTIPNRKFLLPTNLPSQLEFWQYILTYAPIDNGVRKRVSELPIMRRQIFAAD